MQATTAKPFLPSIKFLLDSPVEMFNDQQISVEPRSHFNTSSRKLPTLSLNIPSPNVSPVERNIDINMSGYHHKGNQYQNNLPRLPSISAIGQIESVLNKSVLNNNNKDIVQKPNSIQSLLSPPESPDMTNNPSFNDYETHHNHVAAEQQQQHQQQHQQQQHHQQQQQHQQQHQQQQQRPRLVQPEFHYSKTTSPVYSSNVAPLLTPHYHQSYAAQSYVHPEQRGYDRVGGYHQEHVAYDHTYAEQHRAYPSSNTSPTTLQPAFSPYESRTTTVPSTLPRLEIPSPMMNGGITRRYSTPITTKIMNDQLTSPITGGSSSNNHNNRYQCPYCSKRFSRPSSLRIHTYSHTGEKPFVCTEPGCGRKFSVQSNMRRHLRVHRLGRPVKKVRYDGEVEGVKMLNHGAVMRNC